MNRFLCRLCVTGSGLVAAVTLAAQTAPEQPVKLAEVIVTPSKYAVAHEAATAAASLTAAELEVLPQLGDDLYRSIARLPGLAADDFTAQFWVRGAPNYQVLARFDGVDLIEPFHLKDVDGALSIVDPAIINRLDLVTGGFTADYGGKLGGVLTMETKPVPAPRWTAGLSLTGIGGSGQGLFGSGAGQWQAAVRRGYPDIALRAAGRDDDIEPRYYDATGKCEYKLAPGHVVSFHLLHARDTLRYHRTSNPDLSSSYDSDYAWLRWRGTPTSSLTGETVLSVARLAWNRDGAGRMDGFPFSLRDRRRLENVAFRSEWTTSISERALLRGGVEAGAGDARYDYALSHQRAAVIDGRQVVVTDRTDAALQPDGAAFGGFVSARVQPFMPFVLEPGLRFDRRDYTRDSEWNPRLNAAYEIGRTTVRAAWGLYSQPEGLHELKMADGDTVFRPAERAEHRIIGIDRPIARGVSLRIEAYERINTRLRPRWENLDNPYDLFPEAQGDHVRLEARRGRARGVEMLLAGRGGARLVWNASYALARAEESIGGRWVPRSRDQRHTFYADVTYSPNLRWQFSAACQFHTGWPTTDVIYSLATLSNGRRVTVSANGPVYGLRLPDYHRLDLRATRRWPLSRGELRAFLDIFNAYDRANVIGYDHRVTISGTQVTDVKKPREQLPFLPSIGISWTR